MTILIACLIILAILIFVALSSRNKIFRVYSKYSKVQNTANISGLDLASFYRDKYELYNLSFARSSTRLSDCYIPKKQTVVLSDEVADTITVASLGIVSHEFGHVMQQKENYQLFHLIYILQKITRFTNVLIIPLFLVGMIMILFNLHWYNIEYIALYTSIVLFVFHFMLKMCSIPVEYNASHRALKMLVNNKLVSNKELSGIKKLLNAAALTYVAGLFDDFIIIPQKIKRIISNPFKKKQR